MKVSQKSKIINLDALSNTIKELKKKKKKIVLCHGVFDLLHIGHIKHFKDAKKKGDILVVTLTADKFINKGPNRPYFNETLRAEALAAISMIDYVSINYDETALNLIRAIKPDIYFKGSEYKNNINDVTGMIKKEKNQVRKFGGKVMFSDNLTFSSSTLLNKYGKILNSDQKTFIQNLKNNYCFDEIKKIIDSFLKIKVLVIGETIIDEYIFCEALGKSGKEPVLVFKNIFKERYLGGILAIARHLSSFCKEVEILSMIGDQDQDQEKKYIIKKLEKNIKFTFFEKKNSPTILKRRYIDNIDLRKVFGDYLLNDSIITKIEENKIINEIKKKQDKYDLIIVADYGHGMISPKIAKFISKSKKFFSLNTQINSTNIGIRSLSKYNKINNLVINAMELRHEMSEKEENIINLSKKFIKKIKCNQLCVTEGKKGAFIINKDLKVYKCPAFLNKPKDKIGAGDAYLSLISLCKYKKIDTNLSNYLASMGAAKSADTVGNKLPINKLEILKMISHMLK